MTRGLTKKERMALRAKWAAERLMAEALVEKERETDTDPRKGE